VTVLGNGSAGDREATIVVGVDGSDASRAALVFALREATRRGATVKVVTAWETPECYGLLTPAPGFDVCREDAQAIQSAQMTAALADVDEPPSVSRHIVHGSAGAALVGAAENADLLVVGTSHRHRAGRRLLGSVSETCLRGAGCPVTLVKVPEAPRRRRQRAGLVGGGTGTEQ
jgi:nucleotide-binding universal stress UspA family protein